MMESFLLLIALVLGVWVLNLQGRIRQLELRLSDVFDRLSTPPAPARATGKKKAREPIEPDAPAPSPVMAYANRKPATLKTEAEPEERPGPVDPPSPPVPHEPEKPVRSWSFEELVGGKLPIWVGGISLVFAGFFLVRYTIDAGLLGPGVRSVLACIFALLLIAGSHYGGRLPRIGDSFTADPRIAQSLAGAGVAVLYGTLYMAAEIYGLIGVPLAFVLLIATTILAFALALKHGPPTALMGLIGGFAAPWVAGLGPDNVPVLLLYLGVFLAGLFGLALWRRWLWLLLLASGGGALWTIGLIFTAQTALPLLGLFVLIVGAAAVLVGDRFVGADPRLQAIARYAPMGLALVQLAMLLPQLAFSAIGWGFYGALSAAAIALAWRDERHLPSVFGAILLCLLPLASGWDSQASRSFMAAISIGIAALFGIPAHLRARRGGEGRAYWAIVALLAQAVPFAAAFAIANHEFSDAVWGAIAAALILPAAFIAWQWRDADSRIDRLVQVTSAALAAAMGWLTLGLWLPDDYVASFTIVIAAALAAWAVRTSGNGVMRLAILPLAFGIALLAIGSWEFLASAVTALSGQQLMLSSLPQLGEAAKFTLLPSVLLVALCTIAQFRLGRRTRIVALAAGITGSLAYLWLIAKQAAGIDSPSQFITLGLAERVVMTQLLFLAGWAALRRADRWESLWAKAGLGATAIALFRLAWFDLGVFNPLWVPQALGPAPIANLGTVHLGLGAFWLWWLAQNPLVVRLAKPARIGSLILMVLTALITVRQMVQGNLVSGATIDTGENYLYSAALLALAIGWLAIGIKSGLAILRVAGLALLTAVTLKVFLIDAAALEGVLRILSFLGLGLALIGIGWAYGRVMRAGAVRE
ncbi:MAG: DUF2339 domain-containing protein [Sphingorhabdus sp.]